MSHRGRIAVLLAVALSLVVAGCGGDDEGKPIPTASATALNNELDKVQERLDEGSAGACKDILEGPRGPNMQRVQDLIDAMPDDVDSDVRAALQDSFDRLWDLVEQDCEDKAQQEEENRQQEEPEQTAPEETSPETTPTETTPPEETTPTETTPPEEEQLPPEGDGDNGGGIPGAGGGGGVGPGAKAGKAGKKEKKAR
jgi:hypothetical protein